MCRGLAIISNKSGQFFSCGLSSHTETAKRLKLKEDECLKFEVIIDDKFEKRYDVCVDAGYQQESEQGKEAFAMIKHCEKWILENETEILRQLLFCRTYQKTKGNTDNRYQKTKGDTNNSYQKTKGDTDNSFQETKGDTYNSFQKTKGDTNNSFQETKGNTYNRYQETKGNTNNSFQETKGDTYNSYQKTKGNTDNSNQKTKGNTDNSNQKTKGEIYIDFIKNNDKEIDDFIRELSEKMRSENKRLTWKYLVKLAMRKKG